MFLFPIGTQGGVHGSSPPDFVFTTVLRSRSDQENTHGSLSFKQHVNMAPPKQLDMESGGKKQNDAKLSNQLEAAVHFILFL